MLMMKLPHLRNLYMTFLKSNTIHPVTVDLTMMDINLMPNGLLMKYKTISQFLVMKHLLPSLQKLLMLSNNFKINLLIKRLNLPLTTPMLRPLSTIRLLISSLASQTPVKLLR